MQVFELQLTADEAEHPNLARVGDAPAKTDGQSAEGMPNPPAAVTEGQTEPRREPTKSVRIPQCHPILFKRMCGVGQYDFFLTLFESTCSYWKGLAKLRSSNA